ncbi:hypothetical protein RugamoR64_07100 [Duganella rhizosphaerae]
MLAAGLAWATALAEPPDAGACGAGFGAAAVLCCTLLREAHPISGTDKKLAPAKPKPCCKKFLRVAIAYP